MQELMSHHRVYNNAQAMTPRDCLTRVLFMKYHMARKKKSLILNKLATHFF